jgi:pantoate--beta-alanine ligase
MKTIREIEELRHALGVARGLGKCIGFVPTMGFLHDGHLALIKASVERRNVTVVSIFVNPTQFGPNEDLASYPRDLTSDEALCREAGVDIVFAPEARDVYPSEFQTFVEPGDLAKPLCGAFRPGHFRGVATVVAKLFNMVQPDLAFFGQKDFQQCAVVRRMVRDLDLPLAIVSVPTVREADGLAMSSRNSYLSANDRQRALCISRGLFATEAAFRGGERQAATLVELAKEGLAEVDRLQYLELVDAETLQPMLGRVERPAALCVAAFVGTTRLIDNVVLAP